MIYISSVKDAINDEWDDGGWAGMREWEWYYIKGSVTFGREFKFQRIVSRWWEREG